MSSLSLAQSTARAASSTAEPIPGKRLVLGAAASVAAWVGLRMAIGFPPGAWPNAGSNFVGPGAPSELVVRQNQNGSDGQFLYRLAIEPFTTAVTGHGITLLQPGYRQQRIMTALLAHFVSGVPGISTGLAIILVNAIAIVVALVAGVRLAESLQVDWRWGLLLAIPPGLPASFAFDLTEPVEWACVLCAILAARRSRWLLAGVAFTLAVLARETAGVFIAGYIVESIVVLFRRREVRDWARAWLLLPVLIEVAWQIRLWAVWGSVPALTGFDSTGLTASSVSNQGSRVEGVSHSVPFLGVARTFLNGLATGYTARPTLGVIYLVERAVLLALIVTAAWLLLSRRTRIDLAVTVSWAFAALVALSMAGWVDDIQFLRPTMEVWGLSVLILLTSSAKWSRLLLRAAIVVVCWQVIFGLYRS